MDGPGPPVHVHSCIDATCFYHQIARGCSGVRKLCVDNRNRNCPKAQDCGAPRTSSSTTLTLRGSKVEVLPLLFGALDLGRELWRSFVVISIFLCTFASNIAESDQVWEFQSKGGVWQIGCDFCAKAWRPKQSIAAKCSLSHRTSYSN